MNHVSVLDLQGHDCWPEYTHIIRYTLYTWYMLPCPDSKQVVFSDRMSPREKLWPQRCKRTRSDCPRVTSYLAQIDTYPFKRSFELLPLIINPYRISSNVLCCQALCLTVPHFFKLRGSIISPFLASASVTINEASLYKGIKEWWLSCLSSLYPHIQLSSWK